MSEEVLQLDEKINTNNSCLSSSEWARYTKFGGQKNGIFTKGHLLY